MKLPVGPKCEELCGFEVPTLWHRSTENGESKSYDRECDHFESHVHLFCCASGREKRGV